MGKTATNKTLDDLTLEDVLSDRVTAQDMRITPETLRMQAAIAGMPDAIGWR